MDTTNVFYFSRLFPDQEQYLTGQLEVELTPQAAIKLMAGLKYIKIKADLICSFIVCSDCSGALLHIVLCLDRAPWLNGLEQVRHCRALTRPTTCVSAPKIHQVVLVFLPFTHGPSPRHFTDSEGRMLMSVKKMGGSKGDDHATHPRRII